jgi:hypothetical protein
MRAIIRIWILLASLIGVFAQTQTAGRLTGTVKDVQNAVILAAHVEVENPATAGGNIQLPPTTNLAVSQSFLFPPEHTR